MEIYWSYVSLYVPHHYGVILWSQDLTVDQEKEPCIEFLQENSIESSCTN